eukprot:gene7733-biopygen5190
MRFSKVVGPLLGRFRPATGSRPSKAITVHPNDQMSASSSYFMSDMELPNTSGDEHRRAGEGLAEHTALDAFARPKVRQLRHAIRRQEHVIGLQIPVHHLVPVQVRQALQDLLRVAPDHLIVNSSGFDTRTSARLPGQLARPGQYSMKIWSSSGA